MIKFDLIKRRMSIIRILTFILAAVITLSAFSSCGKNTDNTPKTTLTIMCWNDDFRNMMEEYFIPHHEDLMENVEIKWVNDEIVNYANNVENRLESGERIDLFLGNDEMSARFVNNPNVAALSSLGIDETDLSEQYNYTRVLGSDSNGVQKGSAINAEPGIIVYRTDYAEEYLGITNQEEMQELLSSWDTFLTVAQTLNEKSSGKVKMLASSSEIWMSVECAMTGLWISDGQLAISDETIAKWLNYVNDLESSGAFLDVKALDDDWYEAVNGGVFCFFSAPWLNKNVPLDNADINTIFSSAKYSGQSFGKFKTSLAPNGFIYGGNWLYSSANSANKELVCEIVKAFTCDSEFMRLIALGNMEYVNNASVIKELSEANINNPLFEGLDAFSVYNEAAEGLEFSAPSVYDSAVSQLLYKQAYQYSKGKVSLKQASYNFRSNVWKKYSDITSKPEPID